MYSATAPLPEGVDEMLFAGFLRKSPVELVKCETIDLEVPANSEIVLEGYCEPNERRIEGPFGDHTGYYSLKDEFPMFHITCITHRKDALYPATIVGKPPMEDCYIAKTTERIFLPLIKKQNPGEVIWRIGNNVDPKRDIVIVEGPLDVLEHASDIPSYGGKMGIDATKKWKSEGFLREWPDEIVMSEDIKRLVDKRWKE